jgi:hypothetical protein
MFEATTQHPQARILLGVLFEPMMVLLFLCLETVRGRDFLGAARQ